MLFRRIERSLHIDCCLNQYGHVMASANGHTVMAGFEGVATGTMSVVMSGNRDNVPHILNVADPATEENYKLLCTIAGRKPLCLQCKQEGHYRRDCVTPFCRHHNDFVHATETCAATKSYAAAVKRDLSDTEYDMEQETTTTKKVNDIGQFAYVKYNLSFIQPVVVKDKPLPSAVSASHPDGRAV